MGGKGLSAWRLSCHKGRTHKAFMRYANKNGEFPFPSVDRMLQPFPASKDTHFMKYVREFWITVYIYISIFIYIYHITNRVLDYVLDMTSFNSQICLTLANIWLNTVSISSLWIADNARQVKRQLHDWHTDTLTVARPVHFIVLATQSSSICSCDRHVKHDVTYIYFVSEHAVRLNTEDFYCGNLFKKEIARKMA